MGLVPLQKKKGPQRASLPLPPCEDKNMACCDKELCSMLCGSLDGQGVWGKWIYVYIRLSSFAVHL